MDLTGFSILLIAIALILFVGLTVYYNMHQAASLRDVRQSVDDWLMMYAKDRRAVQRKEVKVDDWKAWLSSHSGLTVSAVERTFDNPHAVECSTTEGIKLVVTTLPKDKLSRELKRFEIRNKNMAHLGNPLLGRSPRKVEVEEKSVVNSGDWFDLEADQVGRAVGVNWGETPRLFFYYVKI